MQTYLCLLFFAVCGALRIPAPHWRGNVVARSPPILKKTSLFNGRVVMNNKAEEFLLKPNPLQSIGVAAKLLLPLVLPAVLVGVFNINPAIAATAGAMAIDRKAKPQDLRSILDSRFGTGGKMSLLQKIFLGVNAKGKLSNWKVGDTRTEISMLINGLSMCAILSVWAAGAYIVQRREEAAELRNMRREVLREKEYRENMYFDAVEDIQKRLADPNLKSGKKANLLKQLKELDPDGRIRDFMAGKIERPDLSNVVDNKRGGGGSSSKGSSGAADTRAESSKKDTTHDGSSSTTRRSSRDDIEDTDDIESAVDGTNSSSIANDSYSEYDPKYPNERIYRDERHQDIFLIDMDDETSDAGRIRHTLMALRTKLLTEQPMSNSQIGKLFIHLRYKFADYYYQDPSKRARLIRKFEEKLDDTQYWVDMAKTI